jgi:hypothetical protein
MAEPDGIEGVAVLLAGGLWKTPGVSEEPEIRVVRWRIIEITDGARQGERHVVGFNELFKEGRVSTPIINVDLPTRRCFTASGRIYHLDGPAGFDRDAQYVWAWWVDANAVSAERDVSPEFEV